MAGRPKRIAVIENSNPSPIECELICLENEFDATKDPEKRREIRDIYGRKMIAVTDSRYNKFVDELVMVRKGFSSGADIAAIGLDTASVLFTPASTKSILAAMSALTTASKTVVDKTYFYEQTLPVLITQMESDRQVVLVELTAGLNGPLQAYGFQTMMRDLVRYYSAGTIDGALVKIQQQASTKANDASKKIKEEIDEQLSAARVREQEVLKTTTSEVKFKERKQQVAGWWEALSPSDQKQQISVIVAHAIAHGVPYATLLSSSADGARVAAGNGVASDFDIGAMGKFLDELKFSATTRLLLASIIKNAAGLKLDN